MVSLRLLVSQNSHACSGRLLSPKRIVAVTFALLFLTSVGLAQFKLPSPASDPMNPPNTGSDEPSDLAMASIEALKRLEKLAPVHTSRGAFEASARLSPVTYEVFKKELESVLEEMGPLLSRLPQSKLKTQIVNALYSYRDGVFWWGKASEPRVITVSALSYRDMAHTPTEAAFSATIPYTVAIHWRHASKYLKRAELLLSN
jgi:hypothetical protein